MVVGVGHDDAPVAVDGDAAPKGMLNNPLPEPSLPMVRTWAPSL
jgi:hypothetical protein